MAGDWIAMRLDLYEDPSVSYMAERLGQREEVVVGFLHRIWSWASRQCHGGRVTNVTLASLGRVTSLHNFPELMVEAGWLQHGVDDNGKPFVEFPNWDRWMAESAKKRLLAAKRQSKKRHADVTDSSRTQRDKSVTTGEESREEKKEGKEDPLLSPCGGNEKGKPEVFGSSEEPQKPSNPVSGDAPPEVAPEDTPEDKPGKPKPPEEPPPEFPEEVREVCDTWLEYKRQTGKPYKPMALKKMATQVRNALQRFGAVAVQDAMEQAMANNYQGWTFCVGKSGGGRAPARPVTFGQQRQQNMVDLLAKLKAEDEAGGQARIGQEAGK